MGNHNAYGTVVHCVVGIGIIERRLQYACREADFVGGRVVICVHGLRTHSPLAPVHRLAQLGQVVGRIPAGGGETVLEVAQFRIYFQAGIVFPFVRIAYLHYEGGEFLLGFGLGLFAHPVQRCNPLAEGLLDVGYDSLHPLLVFLREVLCNVHLAHGLAEYAVRGSHGPLPARLLLLYAGHLAGEELEGGLIEIVAEAVAGCAQHLGLEIVAQHLRGAALDDTAQFLEIGRVADYDFLLLRQSHFGEIAAEVHTRIGGAHFRAAHRVVLGLHIPLLYH